MLSLISLATQVVAAADETKFELKPQTAQFKGLGELSLPGIVSAFITLTLVIAALVFFFMLVIGGIKWIASGGDKAQTETARSQITSALIGLVIVFSAWAIAQLIKSFFGVDIFSLTIQPVTQ